jgi:uncharacterized protein
MIIVEIFKDKHENINGYEVFGHAEYDEYGKDIVCSAISILAQTTLMSLVDVCGIKEEDIQYSIEEQTGYLRVILKEGLDSKEFKDSQIVLKTFQLGVKSIQENYSKYVTLKYGEV